MESAHVEEQAAAFALDALDSDERLRVEAHLGGCPACASAVAHAQGVAGVLGLAADGEHPPAGHYGRFLGRLAAERAAHRAPARISARRQWFALAAAALLVLGLGGWNLYLQQELASQGQLVRLVARAEPRDLSTTTIGDGVHLRAFVDPSTNQVVVAVSRLPELAVNRTYQIWFTRSDGGLVGGGTFRVGDDGTAAVLASAPGGLHAYVGVGITDEPLGGSRTPSAPMVMYWAL